MERLTGSGQARGGKLDLSPGTQQVLEYAVEEARRMGHHYIGTEHLLLGQVRYGEGVALDVLRKLGVTPEQIRRQTRRVLQERTTWAVLSLFGVFLGGMVSALLSGTFKWRKMPDKQWTEIFGPSVAKHWIIVFLAAALLEYAAGIAGGCTSGLAISGGVVLAPASFIFIGGMFASGIVTARLIYRKK